MPPMKLVAMSRQKIEAAQPEITAGVPCAAICIAYPDGRLHRVRRFGSFWRVHHVRFSDCDESGAWCFPERKEEPSSPFPMTRGMAIDILDFVAGLPPEIETLYAACYGGVSRSRGVLAGLAAVHGWDDSELYAGGQPNAWCKTLIVRAARENPALTSTPHDV